MLNRILSVQLGLIWKVPLSLYMLSVKTSQNSMMEPLWLQLLWRPKRRIFLSPGGLHGHTLLPKEIYIHMNRYEHITPKVKLDLAAVPLVSTISSSWFILFQIHLVRAFITTGRSWTCDLSHREYPALSEAVCLLQPWSQSLFLVCSTFCLLKHSLLEWDPRDHREVRNRNHLLKSLDCIHILICVKQNWF